MATANPVSILTGLFKEVYADKLMAGWYTDQDKSTLEDLIKRFNLDRSKYAARQANRAPKGENVPHDHQPLTIWTPLPDNGCGQDGHHGCRYPQKNICVRARQAMP